MKRFAGLLLFGALLAPLVPLPLGKSHAADKHVLRIGTLAPPGSSWDKVFRAFNHTLREKSDGRLSTKLYGGGVAGDERDVIRKMKVGQMDGASLTSIGLGQIVRSLLVLQLPGMFESREQLKRVREQMNDEFEAKFEEAGYMFMGWGDVGDFRIFSDRPLMEPEDLRPTRPWMWREDPISKAFFKHIGANGVSLGLPEVLPALQTGMVDTVSATAISAVALQWFRHVTHMSKSYGQPVVGATVLRKEVYDSLPPDLQEILMEASGKAHDVLAKRIIDEDARAAQILRDRGIEEFDPNQNRPQWEKVLVELATKLAGRLYTREFAEKVYSIAHPGEALPEG